MPDNKWTPPSSDAVVEEKPKSGWTPPATDAELTPEKPYAYSFSEIQSGAPTPAPISTQEAVPTDLGVQQAQQKKVEQLRQSKLSNQISAKAHSIGYSPRAYMQEKLAPQQASEFLDPEEQKVFNAKNSIERTAAMETLIKSKVDRKAAVEKLLLDGYKSELSPTMANDNNVVKVPISQDEKVKLKQELSDIDGSLKNLTFFKDQKMSDAELPDDERKKMFGDQGFAEQGFDAFPQQQKVSDFLNDNKSDIAEHYPELVKLLPENPTPQDIMKAYYNVLYQDYQNKSKDIPNDEILDNLKKAIHTVTGTLFMSQDEQDYVALWKKLKSLALITLLNTYRDTPEDKNMAKDFLTNIGREMFPDYKGTTKTENAQDISDAMDHLGIDKNQVNKFAANIVTKTAEKSTAEDLVDGTGAVLGSIQRLMLMGAVTEGAGAVTGLNSLIEASAKSEDIATRVGSFMLRRAKDVSTFGLTGDKNPITDAVGFGAGVEGAEALMGKYEKVVRPILNKIYSDAGAAGILEKTGKFTGAIAGITAGSEMNNYTSALWNVMANDSSFKNEFTDRGYFDKDGNWTLSNAAKNVFKKFITNAPFGFLGLSAHDVPKAKQEFGRLADEFEQNNIDPKTVETLRNLSSEKKVEQDGEKVVNPLEDVIRTNKQILDFHLKGQRPTYKPDQVAQATSVGLPSPKNNIFLQLPQGKPGQAIEPAQPIQVWDRNTGEHKSIFPDKEGYYAVKKAYGYPEDMKFQLMPDGSMKMDSKAYEEVPMPDQGGVMLKYKGKEEPSHVGETRRLVQHDTPSGKSYQEVIYTPAKEKAKKGVATTPEGTTTPITSKEKPKKGKGVVETDEGVSPIEKKVAPEAKQEVTPQDFEKGQREVSAPVNNIHTATDKFQNRTSEFSQETVDNIKSDVKEGKFDPNKLDAIRIWKNPKDGKTYVISGHSRLEAFKQLDAEGVKGFDNIPAIDMSNLSEKDAMDFATKESNTMATRESLNDRSKIYRKMITDKESDASVIKEAKKNEKSNWKYVYRIAHLDPKGKSISDIHVFEKTTDESAKKQTQELGEWVGELKSRNPELSTYHENEIHDYLMDHMDKHKGANDRPSMSKFIEFAEKRIESLKASGNLSSDSPLNLERQVVKSDVEKNYDSQEAEKRKAFDAARIQYDAKKDKFTARGASPEELTEALKQYKGTYDRTQKEFQDILGKKGTMLEAVKNQTNLWDMLDNKIDAQIREIKGKIDKNKGQAMSSLIGLTPGDFDRIHVTALKMAKALLKAGKSVDHVLEQVGKFIDSQISKIRDSIKKKEGELNRNKDNEEKANEIKGEITKGNDDIKKLNDIIHHDTEGLKPLLDTEKMKLLPEGVRYDDDATKRITDEIGAKINGSDKKNVPVEKLKEFALSYFKESLQDTKKISSEGASKIVDRINGADTHIKLMKAINSITAVMRKEKMGELYDESVKSRSIFSNAKESKKYASLYEDLNVLSKADINNMPVEFQVQYNEMSGQVKGGTVNRDNLTSLAEEARQYINSKVSESGIKKRELSPEQRAEYRDVLKDKSERVSIPSDFDSKQKESISALKELIANHPDKFSDIQLQQVDEILNQLKEGWKSPFVEDIVASVKAGVVMPEVTDRVKKDKSFEDKLKYYWEHPTHLLGGGKTTFEKLQNMTAPYKAAMFEFFKDGQKSTFYNNSYGKNAIATNKHRVFEEAFLKPYREIENKLGKTPGEKLASSIRAYMFAMTNEDYKGSLTKVDESMKNMIASGDTESKYKELFDAHVDAYNNFYKNEDGKIATKEEMWNKLSGPEKELYGKMRSDLDGKIGEMNKYVTTDVRGNHYSPIRNYAPRNIMGINGEEIGENENDILNDLLEGNNMSAKKYMTLDTQSSHERTDPSGGYYNMDAIGNMNKHVRDVSYIYHKAQAIKEIMAFINHPEMKAALGDSRWKDFKNDMKESIILDKAKPSRDAAYNIVHSMLNNVRAASLMDVGRQASEFVSQILVSANGAGVHRLFPAMNDIANHGDKMREFAEITGMSASQEYAKDIKWSDTAPRYTGMDKGVGNWWQRTTVERASKALTDYSMQVNTAGWRNANKAGGFANLYKAMEDAGIDKPDWGTIADMKEWYGSLSPSQKGKLQDAVMTANMNGSKQQSPSSVADEANAFRMQNNEKVGEKLWKSMSWFLSHYTRAQMARQISSTVDFGKAVGNGDLSGMGNSALTMGTGMVQAMAYKFLMVQIGGLAARGVYSALGADEKEKKSRMVIKANEQLTPHGMEKEAIGSILDSYIGGYSIPLRYMLGDVAEELNALITEHAGENPLHYDKERDAITYNSPVIHDLSEGRNKGRVISTAFTDMFLKNVKMQGIKVDNLEKVLSSDKTTPWEKTDALMNLANTFMMVNPLQRQIDNLLKQETDKQINEAKIPMTQAKYEEAKAKNEKDKAREKSRQVSPDVMKERNTRLMEHGMTPE